MWPNVQSVFETGWTTVRNWCPRTSVHQAGTRVKTWCLPPLLHEIFFCAREIGVAHSWAKLYVATTGDHAWCFNKTEDRVVFLRSIWGICVTSLLYSSLFFFIYRAFEKISNEGSRGCVSNGENFRIVHLFFFSSSFFFFRKLHWNGWKIQVNHRCTILLFENDQWKNRLLVLKLTFVKLQVVFFDFNLEERMFPVYLY